MQSKLSLRILLSLGLSLSAQAHADPDDMPASEGEAAPHSSAPEQAKLKTDTQRLNGETAQAQKASADNQAKGDKVKSEIATLKQLRQESAARFLEAASERDRTEQSLKSLEQDKATAETEFQQTKLQEKQGTDQLAKLKLEFAQKKAKLETYIASLKERYRAAHEHMTAQQNEKAEMERNQQKLEAQAKAGEAEVQRAENPGAPEPVVATAPAPAAAPATTQTAVATSANTRAPASTDLTFKRKCRVFDGPVRGAKVVAVQETGVSIAKSEEGKEWIAFLLNDGRKAFAAKNCFR